MMYSVGVEPTTDNQYLLRVSPFMVIDYIN